MAQQWNTNFQYNQQTQYGNNQQQNNQHQQYHPQQQPLNLQYTHNNNQQQWNSNNNNNYNNNPNMYNNNNQQQQNNNYQNNQQQNTYNNQMNNHPNTQNVSPNNAKSEEEQSLKSMPKSTPKVTNYSSKTREYDHLFKLVLIGDATVGKTSLLLRFADDAFKDNYISTIGVDFRFRTLNVNNELVKLQIWDTAGQERFRTITSAYYRGADGVILIYDITNRSTFDNVQTWMDEVHKVTGDSISKLIIGNKNDLENKRDVQTEMAEKYAASVGAELVETSAKTAKNVDKSFTIIATELVRRGKVGRKSITIRSADDDDDYKKKGCCLII